MGNAVSRTAKHTKGRSELSAKSKNRNEKGRGTTAASQPTSNSRRISGKSRANADTKQSNNGRSEDSNFQKKGMSREKKKNPHSSNTKICSAAKNRFSSAKNPSFPSKTVGRGPSWKEHQNS